jgi:hypothetical protein
MFILLFPDRGGDCYHFGMCCLGDFYVRFDAAAGDSRNQSGAVTRRTGWVGGEFFSAPSRLRLQYFPMRLIVRSSPIHAAGVFTLERIPKDTLVVEYTGPRIRHDDADNLYRERAYTYLFGVGDGTYVVDGYGMAMYLNHSCEPNCETEEDEEEHVWIRAIRDIEPGEELVYDYYLYDGEGECPCYCGAKHCRGTMYSPAELRKRKRAAGKQLRGKRASGKPAKKRRPAAK